jgi:hypothetical protein
MLKYINRLNWEKYRYWNPAQKSDTNLYIGVRFLEALRFLTKVVQT